jgi:acyl-CoA thioester hydrolase
MSADESGCLIGRTHHFPVRVYFADTDAAGLVYHATYFVFAERARTEMMRLAGFDHGDLHKRLGMLLGVRSCQAEYLRPARLDDLLEIRTTIEELAGASLRLRQEVWPGLHRRRWPAFAHSRPGARNNSRLSHRGGDLKKWT